MYAMCAYDPTGVGLHCSAVGPSPLGDSSLNTPPWTERGSVRERCVGTFMIIFITHRVERLRGQRLREEVGEIVDGGYKGDADPHVLNHLAHEEVATCHVLHLGVMLGVVCRVASTGVVHGHFNGFAGGKT